MKRIVLGGLCAAVLVIPSTAAAQDARLTRVDRIVAVVGRTVIAASRVEEELNVLRASGEEFPADSAGRMALRHEILDRIVNDEIMMQAARQDTMIRISEQEVLAAVEPAIRQVRSQFASEMEYDRQLRATGFSTQDDYRRWVTDQKRRDLTREMFQAVLQQRGDIEPLPPTETEMRAFYDDVISVQPPRPATVSFRQLVIRMTADSAERRRTFLLADSLRYELTREADFNDVARRFSDDPGSRDKGGEMGWVRRGQGLLPRFEEVAFSIRPGRVVGPVETAYGWHLIEVTRSQPAEVQVRHILISPEITDEDRERARALATDVAGQLESGAPFDTLAALYHEPMMDRVADDMPVDGLDDVYRGALEGAAAGDVIGPVEVPMGPAISGWAIFDFLGSREGGSFTFEDLRDQIRENLSQQNGLDRYIQALKAKTFVEVRL
jgi:peptidyl-prolyl cis-trans isomerase SurA